MQPCRLLAESSGRGRQARTPYSPGSGEDHLLRTKADIVALKGSVSRGVKETARTIGSRIEEELDQLQEQIVALPPLRLSGGGETAILKYRGNRVPSARLASDLLIQEGVSEDLVALRARVIAQRCYRLNEFQEVSLRFYPPGEVFVVQDVGGGKEETALDFLALVDRPQRFSAVLSRAIKIEAACCDAAWITDASGRPIPGGQRVLTSNYT